MTGLLVTGNFLGHLGTQVPFTLSRMFYVPHISRGKDEALETKEKGSYMV